MQQPPPLPTVNPYAAPTARVIDPLQTGTQELADRGTRLLAKIVDGLIFGVIAFVMIMAGAFIGKGTGDSNVAGVIIAFAAGAGVIVLLVVNWVLLHRHGQTIAKRWFKIKIVRTDGSPCSLLRVIFARWLPVALLGFIPLVGYIVSLLDPLLIFRDDYRCLHDQIADTLVVKA
jgi:uncharacterized RDD family membrane protein YckC